MNGYISVITHGGTGTHFQRKLLGNMENVYRNSDLKRRKSTGSDISKHNSHYLMVEFHPYPVNMFFGHPNPFSCLLSLFSERNTYISTGIRHPLRLMGTRIRKTIFSIFRNEIDNGIYDSVIEKSVRLKSSR